MALTTAEHLLSYDDWTLLAEDVSTFVGQVASVSPAVVYVGSAEPAPGGVGLVLSSGADRALVLTDLTTEKIWGRAARAGEPAKLVVISG